MQIDRSRFLLLTAALAASTGCTIINNNAADSGSGPVDTGTTSVDTGSGETSTADTGTADTMATDGATEADVVSCDDMTGTASSCSSIVGTGCHGGEAGPNGIDIQCDSYATNYKPRVASAAVDCMAKLGSPTCEAVGLDFSTCDLAPLAAACPDPAAATFCAKVISDCSAAETGAPSGFTAAECQARLNGLLPDARDHVAHCFVTEGLCSNDGGFSLDDCIHNLTF